MSVGYGASARIVFQDDKKVVYEYCAQNLNDSRYKNPDYIYDGLITISKDALVEPEIHEKLKRMPSGRKRLITKRVHNNVDYQSLIKAKQIIIKNSSYCWRFTGDENNIGGMAMKVTFRIFDLYQENGELPQTVSIFY